MFLLFRAKPTGPRFGTEAAEPSAYRVAKYGDLVGPAVGAGLDVVAAADIAAVDQHIADAGGAHFAEGDFLRGGGHRYGLVLVPTFRPPAS